MAQMSDRAVSSDISVCALHEPNVRKLSNGLSFLELSTRSCLVTRLENQRSHIWGTRSGLSALQLSVMASKAEGRLGRE